MPDPITPEDLYGPSNPPTPEGESEPQVTEPLPVEETPEITLENQPPPPEAAAPPAASQPQPRPKTSFVSTLGALLFFVGLFGVGIWLSGYIRQYFPGGFMGVTPQQTAENVPTVTPAPADPFAGWQTHRVTSGSTQLPIDGISYKLPATVLSPICDTTTCMSQGTYLPGGTRFTVAPRGAGQQLTDFRGSAISDAGGTVFTTQNTTVNGHSAQLFTGNFSGKTVGGYGFTQMRGYMIEVTPALSLEVNHFTPVGVTAEFTADDELFDKIVSTLVMPGMTSPPVSATTSGY